MSNQYWLASEAAYQREVREQIFASSSPCSTDQRKVLDYLEANLEYIKACDNMKQLNQLTTCADIYNDSLEQWPSAEEIREAQAKFKATKEKCHTAWEQVPEQYRDIMVKLVLGGSL